MWETDKIIGVDCEYEDIQSEEVITGGKMESREREMKGPLDGLRVIDWTMWQFGPVSTMMLADMGAEVIKIESLDGIEFRCGQGFRNPIVERQLYVPFFG